MRNGLMFLDVKPLTSILDDTIAAQPFLAALAQDLRPGGFLARSP